jgi:putative transcriptional regulator
MTPVHHPGDETLADFARGTLDRGRRVVVAAHMELCPSCHRLMQGLELAAGEHLERLTGTPLAEGALRNVLAQLDGPAIAQAKPSAPVQTDLPFRLRALEPYELGRWRWIGPGVHWRSVGVPAQGGARVFLLKAAPGTHLPHHAHDGTELTVILKGAFAHADGRFGVGDCDDADDSVEHRPVVEDGEECVCLVAMHGDIRLLSLVGRLLQPFIRM